MTIWNRKGVWPAIAAAFIACTLGLTDVAAQAPDDGIPKYKNTEMPQGQRKAVPGDHSFKMLRNPATKGIPAGNGDLAYSGSLAKPIAAGKIGKVYLSSPKGPLADTPTAIAATNIKENSFTANWNAVTGATGYELDVASDAAFASILTGYNSKAVTGTSASVIGLTASKQYFYRLRAKDATSVSGNSNTIDATTLAVLPAPLATPATIISEAAFTANWNAVTGATAYQLDVATDAAFTAFVVAYENREVTGTSAIIPDLASNVQYFYRLRAKDAIRTSVNSNVVSATTLLPLPATAASAATNVGEKSFTANWSAVTGATAYQLDVATDNAFANFVSGYNNKGVTGTSVTVTGLTPSTPYFYRLRAIDFTRVSVNSNAISLTTLAALPATVAAAATSVGETGFTANWSAVTGATAYQLDVATDAGFTAFVTNYNNKEVTGTSFAVTGLASNVQYFYRLRAKDATRTASNSNTINVTTLIALAVPVANAATNIGQNTFTANWSTAAGATAYQLDVATDAGFTSFVANFNNREVTGTSAVVNGLTPNTNYFYRLRSIDATRVSANSNVISVTTLATLSAPVATAATNIGETGFTANWNAVAGATAYKLDVATNNTFTAFVTGYNNKEVTGTSAAVTGLVSNRQYFYRLRAVDATRTSVNSNIITVTTAQPVLAAPVANAATNITQTSFSANWETVAEATAYQLDVATDGAFTAFVTGFNNKEVTGSTASVTGLTAGTVYHYRLRAKDATRVSVNSNIITVTTTGLAALNATTVFAATAITETSFNISWSAITEATAYQLDVATNAGFTAFVTGFNNKEVTGTSAAVTGLTLGTQYFVRMRAKDAARVSANSNTLIVNTLAALNPPVAAAATTVGDVSFTANWSTVANATGYQLDVATNNTFTAFVTGYNNLAVTGTSRLVSGLTAGTQYFYRVRATDATRVSGNSNTIISATTLPALATTVATAATAITQTTFNANWNAVAGATAYQLDVATDAGFTALVAGYSSREVTGTTFGVAGLTQNTAYFYRLRAKDATRVSVNSNVITLTTVQEPLSAPVAAVATSIGDISFTANWSAVTGATAYQLDLSKDANFATFITGYNNKEVTGVTAAITGMLPNTQYFYRVRAKDATRVSVNSNTISATTLPSLAAPVANAATAVGVTGFTANWSTSVDATGYWLDVATDNGFTAFVTGFNSKEVTGTSLAITGLSASTQYFYRLRAKDATRNSANSNTISVTTLVQPLDAPVATAATLVGDISFTANWNAVTGATAYQLDVATDAAFTAFVTNYNSKEVTGTSFMVTGLTANTGYFYRLRAKDATRVSANSNVISTTSLQSLAATVAAAATSVTHVEFTANWSAVTSATAYLLDVSTNTGFTAMVTGYNGKEVTGVTSVVTGLTPNTPYFYRLRAKDATRVSVNSNVISVTTLLAPLDAPVATAATAIGETGFTANWNAVTGATAYQLDVATNSGFTAFVTGFNNKEVTGTSAAVTGLTAGTQYFYRLRAKDATRVSVNSNTITVTTTAAGALGATTAMTATAITQTGFTANWSAVTGATAYQLDVATNSGFTAFVTGFNNKEVTGTSAAVTGLTAGTQYFFRLRSKDATRVSGNSNTVDVMTVALLPAPVASAATSVTQTGFTANWSAVTGATAYQLDVATNSGFTAFVTGFNNKEVTGTSDAVTGLTANTQYFYRLRAKDATRVSVNSNTINVTTLAVLPAPTAMAATAITETGFTANWSAVTGATGYGLDVATNTGFTSFVTGYNNLAVTGTSAAVTGLTAGTQYFYRLRAMDAVRVSANSNTINVTTTAAGALGATTAMAATSITETGFTANWTAVTGATAYQLDVATNTGFTAFVTGFNNKEVTGTSAAVTGLTANTQYFFRLRTKDATRVAANSNVVNTTTALPLVTIKSVRDAVNTAGVPTTTGNVRIKGVVHGTDIHTGTGANDFQYSLIDATGGITIRNTNTDLGIADIAEGDEIEFIGSISHNNGLMQMTTSKATRTAQGLARVTPKTVTVLNEATESDFVKVNDLTVKDPAQWIGTATNTAGFNVTVTFGGKDWTMRIDRNVELAKMTYGEVFGSATSGISLAGLGGQFDGTTPFDDLYQILPYKKSDITAPLVGPVAATANLITETGFTANWSSVIGATAYQLDVATDNGFTAFVTGFNNKEVTGTSAAVTGLTANTQYFYRLRAKDATRTSVNSNTISVNTLKVGDLTASIAAAATNITENSFTANWSAVTGATAYQLDVATNTGFTAFVTGFNNKEVTGTSAAVTGLAANTDYFFRVRAKDATKVSANSNVISLKTALGIVSIKSVRDAVNAAGVPTTVGSVRIKGIVHGTDLHTGTGANDFQYSLIDATGAITVRNTNTDLGIADIAEGDEIEFTGTIGHFNGLMQMTTSKAIRTKQGQPRMTPKTVTALGESTESDFVRMEGMTVKTPAQWTGSAANLLDFNVDATVGGVDVQVRISRLTELAKMTYAEVFGTSTTNIIMAGLGGQFDNATPFDAGYQFLPYKKTDISTLNAPVATAATAVTDVSFTANWTAATGATAYLLDVSGDNTFATFVTGYNGKEVTGTSASVTGLTSDKQYFYRLRSKDANAFSGVSNVIAVKTAIAPLLAPVFTATTGITDAAFNVNWTAVSNATSYELDVATDAGFTAFVAGFQNRAVSGTSAFVFGLEENTSYFFRMRSKDATRTSVNSASGTAKTAKSATIGAPVATMATFVKTTGFTANWTAVRGADSYLLDVSADPKFATFVTGYQAKSVTGTSAVVTGLNNRVDYYFRLRAKDTDRTSVYSNAIYVQTSLATGTDEIELGKKLTLFPNPASESVQLSTDDAELNAMTFFCQIYDAKGGMLYKKQASIAQLNQDLKGIVGGLNAGVYTINLANQGVKISKRFIKE